MWEMGDRVPSADVLLGVRQPGWDVHMILKTPRGDQAELLAGHCPGPAIELNACLYLLLGWTPSPRFIASAWRLQGNSKPEPTASWASQMHLLVVQTRA